MQAGTIAAVPRASAARLPLHTRKPTLADSLDPRGEREDLVAEAGPAFGPAALPGQLERGLPQGRPRRLEAVFNAGPLARAQGRPDDFPQAVGGGEHAAGALVLPQSAGEHGRLFQGHGDALAVLELASHQQGIGDQLACGGEIALAHRHEAELPERERDAAPVAQLALHAEGLAVELTGRGVVAALACRASQVVEILRLGAPVGELPVDGEGLGVQGAGGGVILLVPGDVSEVVDIDGLPGTVDQGAVGGEGLGVEGAGAVVVAPAGGDETEVVERAGDGFPIAQVALALQGSVPEALRGGAVPLEEADAARGGAGLAA